VNILRDVIKIKSNNRIGKFNANGKACSYFGLLDIDSGYSNQSTNADFVLFLGVQNSPSESWLAFASVCALDQETSRPVAGFIIFNEAKVTYTDGNYSAQLDTFVHEALHTLYFHPLLFKIFPKNANNESFLFQDNDSTWKMRGDTILREAREYFDCPTMNGVPLENGGGSTSAGAHFEKTVFADEMMTPDDTLETKLSIFSLAVAKDSGFYIIDLSKAEHIFWGKGEGCSFVEQRCSSTTADEFCHNLNDVACSDNLMYRTLCVKSHFTGDCQINLQMVSCKKQKKSSKIYEQYGMNSLCLPVKVKYSLNINGIVHQSRRFRSF
jgi:leishmanolysin